MKRLLAVLILGVIACQKPVLRVAASQTTLLANGYDTMIFRISGPTAAPHMQVNGDKIFCHLQSPHKVGDHWEATLQCGVLPGTIKVRISSARQHALESLTLLPQVTDSASDGTPDFLRLDDESDRQVFRHWFTYLAELQYFIAADKLNPEIIDCSSLLRYSYREALRDHDAAWIAGARLPIVEANSSIRKYSFPHTLLGAKLFRVRSGAYAPADLNNGAFAEFADAKTLQEHNTFFISRDISRAQPGDLLFYRRETDKGLTYHSMIFLGPSKVKADGEIYVVYHTGPDGTNNGEIRRLTLTQLLHFPNPQWHPIAANQLFLGVYRWNILKVIS